MDIAGSATSPAPPTRQRCLPRGDSLEHPAASACVIRPRRRAVVALALSIALHGAVLAALAVRRRRRGAGSYRARAARSQSASSASRTRLVPRPRRRRPALTAHRQVGRQPRIYPSGCGGTIYTGIGATVNRAGFIIEPAPTGPAQQSRPAAGRCDPQPRGPADRHLPCRPPVGLRPLSRRRRDGGRRSHRRDLRRARSADRLSPSPGAVGAEAIDGNRVCSGRRLRHRVLPLLHQARARALRRASSGGRCARPAHCAGELAWCPTQTPHDRPAR